MAKVCTLVLACFLIFTSCKNNKIHVDDVITHLADIQCRAVKLKDARFELSSQIRKLEEEPITKQPLLDSLYTVADALKAESLQVADSLRIIISNFLQTEGLSKKDEIIFKEKINTLVEKCKSGQ